MDSMEEFEAKLLNNKKYILNMIAKAKLAPDHILLDPEFKNSAELTKLTILSLILPDNDNKFLEGFFKKAFGAGANNYDREVFLQIYTEVHVLFYIYNAMMENEIAHKLTQIEFEKEVSPNNQKNVEYSFTFNHYPKRVNVEVKRLTCDPLVKENEIHKTKFIKPLFKKINLEDYVKPKQLESYQILESSTHYQTLKDEIKKINEKFDGVNRDDNLNIGVLDIPYATSLEEFLSYFANSKKGLLVNDARIFTNIDAIVLHSPTASPKIDEYESNNAITFIINKDFTQEDAEMLQQMKFDNIVYAKGHIAEDLKKYAEEVYGCYKLSKACGIMSFYREDTSDAEITLHHAEISKLLNSENQK